MNYELISTVEVGPGGQSSIEFTDIPQNGENIVVELSLRSTTANGGPLSIEFNNDSSLFYSSRSLTGSSSGSASSSTTSSQSSFKVPAAGASEAADSNFFGNSQLFIGDYASTYAAPIMYTGVVGDSAGTSANQEITVGVYDNTDPITSLKITGDSAFAEHSQASLYVVTTTGAAGSVTQAVPKAVGGSINYVGGTFYHLFTSSSTFTPNVSITGLDYAIVGGGGGGQNAGYGGQFAYSGNGGGAGGLVSTKNDIGGTVNSKYDLAATTYSITVGNGGSAGDPANDGNPSVFHLHTANGGAKGNRINGNSHRNRTTPRLGGAARDVGLTISGDVGGGGGFGGYFPSFQSPTGGGSGGRGLVVAWYDNV